MKSRQVSTEFDLEPLNDGNVLIEFFGDDGVTINKQVITVGCLRELPDVAIATLICMHQGKDAAIAFLGRFQKV